MQTTENQLFDKIEKLTKTVKDEYRQRGLVLPSRDKFGNVCVGSYVATKQNNFWFVKNKHGEIVAGPLNLAKTAIVLANDLALGRFIDKGLINNDAWYGFKSFEENVAKIHAQRARKRNNGDRVGYNLELAQIAGHKKNFYKKTIDSRFSKLCKLI